MNRIEKRYYKNLDFPHSRLEILALVVLHLVNELLKLGVTETEAFEEGLELAKHEGAHLSQFGPLTELSVIALIVEETPDRILTSCEVEFRETDPNIRLRIAAAPGPEEMSNDDHNVAIRALAQLGIQITKEI